ncbi:MAG: pseudouridine synthase [Bacteroidetes bacterium]|nr:pseudouridine synthase [Bacteroidota bacterium]
MIYILFYKPFNVLSQFSPEPGKKTLSDFLSLPKDVYPVGRLDYDSEGLLLLTNDNVVKKKLTDPSFGHPKTYYAQVERVPDEQALAQLRSGVVIEGERTRPAEVTLLSDDPGFPERSVPIRFRKNVPTAWLSIVLREGRNRQVRKMTAAVGHPTLRLVRVRIGALGIDGLTPGSSREIQRSELSV